MDFNGKDKIISSRIYNHMAEYALDDVYNSSPVTDLQAYMSRKKGNKNQEEDD